MLPRIVLFALQLAAAWYLGSTLTAFVGRGFGIGRSNEIFVDAVIYPLLVVLVGFAGSKVMKNVKSPSAATLLVTLALSIALALSTLIPQVVQAVETAIPLLRSSQFIYPLVGALAGYYIKR